MKVYQGIIMEGSFIRSVDTRIESDDIVVKMLERCLEIHLYFKGFYDFVTSKVINYFYHCAHKE